MATATIDPEEMTEIPKTLTPEQRIAKQAQADKDAIAQYGTVRIKLRQSLAGVRFGHERGDIIDWRADEAKRLIEAGIAVPVSTKRPGKRG